MTEFRGESAQAHVTSWTYVRGEGGEEESRSRGEANHGGSTGTFSRGEDDYDPKFMAPDSLSTETKERRGDTDFDAAATCDSDFDDPSDRRRITPLGLLEARQAAAGR